MSKIEKIVDNVSINKDKVKYIREREEKVIVHWLDGKTSVFYKCEEQSENDDTELEEETEGDESEEERATLDELGEEERAALDELGEYVDASKWQELNGPASGSMNMSQFEDLDFAGPDEMRGDNPEYEPEKHQGKRPHENPEVIKKLGEELKTCLHIKLSDKPVTSDYIKKIINDWIEDKVSEIKRRGARR